VTEGFGLHNRSKLPDMDSNGSTEELEIATGYGIQGTSPGTKSGTIDARRDALQALVAVWDTLDDATVNRIMRLIQG